MIRDPSDGSVKEITPEANEINLLAAKKASEEITTSGLPTASTRPQMIAKLEKSREWLKNYHERKEK
jgi:hypothetical protein